MRTVFSSILLVLLFTSCRTREVQESVTTSTAAPSTLATARTASRASSDFITVCSFNIQFLGNSTKRDNRDLAAVVKDYDIVVVQELVAPPYPGTFPDGSLFKPDSEAQKFFESMSQCGFHYVMSEEDTGTGDTIHVNSSATEWWVTFYKTNKVHLANDLPHGFLAEDRSNHPDYERVPYAFAFRDNSRRLDFVLISVHLQPDSGAADRARRKHELDSIFTWIGSRNTLETDFIVLGDINIEDAAELSAVLPNNRTSLNRDCRPTNTNVNGPKPYDHVIFNPAFTSEMDQSFGFQIIDLVETMRATWTGTGAYPGGPPYDHNGFRAVYSDHNPVYFRLKVPAVDDD